MSSHLYCFHQVDVQHLQTVFILKKWQWVVGGKYVLRFSLQFVIHSFIHTLPSYSQSFQVLIQYKLLRYLSSTSSASGGVSANASSSTSSGSHNARNELAKKSGYSTLRNGTEQNAPVVLMIPVGINMSWLGIAWWNRTVDCGRFGELSYRSGKLGSEMAWVTFIDCSLSNLNQYYVHRFV